MPLPGEKKLSEARFNAGSGRTLWRLVILTLCLFVLAALFVDAVFSLPAEVSRLLGYFDTFVCFIFLGDFIYNLITSANRGAYLLRWGWLDLLSSLPNLRFLRWGRLARLLRIVWLIRGFRSFRELIALIYRNRAQGTLATVALLSFLLVVFAAIAVLLCETVPAANIRTAPQALWWAWVTITTVGYGDFYPVTPAGRLVALGLMTAGVGLFGVFTAYIATFFINGEDELRAEKAERQEKVETTLLLDELRAIRRSLEQREGKSEKKID